jgi:FtsH-binding integral membrane protein
MIFAASGACALVLGIIGFFVYKTALEAILGIIIGCLYVIIDTQIIIFKAQSGAFEPFIDATSLFTDLFKIFVEIVKLLVVNGDKKKKEKK